MATITEAQAQLAQMLARNQNRAQTRSSGLVSGGSFATPLPNQQQGPSLVEQFQLAMNSANEANEKRYQEGLGLFEEQRRLAASMGAQEASDIRRGASMTASRGQADLVSRGLGNTTAVLAPRVAAQREEAAGMGRLKDRQTQRSLGIIGDKIGFIERREDVGPDFSLLAQLMQAQGQGSVMPSSGPITRERRERTPSPQPFAQPTQQPTQTVRGTQRRIEDPTNPQPLTADILAEIRAGLAANRAALGNGGNRNGTLRIAGGKNPTTTFTPSSYYR